MDAVLFRSALAVLAVDPAAIGGLWLRARASPFRQILIDAFSALPLPYPLQRLTPNVADAELFGGLDTATTLRLGRPVLRKGLLDRTSVLILPMAERCDRGLAAKLGQKLDTHRQAIIALDETAEDGEGLPVGLADRLGLFLDLDSFRMPEPLVLPEEGVIAAARGRLSRVRLPALAVEQVVRACTDLAIISQRAPMLTLTVARILAALANREVVEEEDLTGAAQLTLAHRASPHSAPPPPPPEAEECDAPTELPPEPTEARSTDPDTIPSDLLVEAVRAVLPEHVLQNLAEARAIRSARGLSGSGLVRAGNRNGRPLPPRRGRPHGEQRLDLIATLRAAAPFQTLRRTANPQRAGQALLVDPGDFHIRRSKIVSDRVLIFAVDASGSAAIARLAEAKGAVETLLARAYSRRDHVALLTFRGQSAELLLPPTRSLVQTKNRLRGLPGGGPTPLAGGLKLALDTAQLARAKGMTPTLAFLTDGKGNIALDGSPDRAQSEQECEQIARAIRAAGLASLVLDLAPRPQPRLSDLSRIMGARYIVLPRSHEVRGQSSGLAAVLGAAMER